MVVYTLHQRGKDKSLGQSKLVDQASADLLKSAVAVTIIFIITIGLFFKCNTNMSAQNNLCDTFATEHSTCLIKVPFSCQRKQTLGAKKWVQYLPRMSRN